MIETRTDQIARLLNTSACGCTSYALLDNEGGCLHCQAHPADTCAADCPVGDLDEIQAGGDCSELDRSWICIGKWISTDPRLRGEGQAHG